jgi:hypothetical protein
MKTRFIIGILVMMVAFEGLCICMAIDVINDKNAYILGLQSDKSICKQELTEQYAEYNKLESKFKDCKRRCGGENVD